jgi:hypothetical protein
MPAAVFNPLASVIAHTQVPVNVLTFSMLEAEDALLIHTCRRSATRQEWRRYNKDGKLIVFVRHSPVLTYSITATALDPTGENLGNYHPGRCLSDRALAFVNGGRTPFQFEAEVDSVIPGKLILLNPVQDPGAGDATEVSFDIEHAFIDLDDGFVEGGEAEPATPTLFVEIPAQDAVELSTACRTALLRDVFTSVNAFAGAVWTATLYDGDPAGAGVALTDPLTLAAWTHIDEPGAEWVSRARNNAITTWLDAATTDRTCSYILFERNGITVAIKQLTAPLVIPAYYGVKAPVHALALQLTWPFDGAPAMSPTAGDRPARIWIGYVCGGDRTYQTATLVVQVYDALDVELDSFPVAASAANFTVAGLTVTPGTLTGTDLAPGGGWAIAYVKISMNNGADGPAVPVSLQEFHTATITVGNPVVLTAAPVLDLADTPD